MNCSNTTDTAAQPLRIDPPRLTDTKRQRFWISGWALGSVALLITGTVAMVTRMTPSPASPHDVAKVSTVAGDDTTSPQEDETFRSQPSPDAAGTITPTDNSPTVSAALAPNTASIKAAWRVGEIPVGFTEVLIDDHSQTIQAPLSLEGDFVLELGLNVANQSPRDGAGIEIALDGGTAAFSVTVEIAQAFSNGRTLAVHWPGSGIKRIDVTRGLRTVRLTRSGRTVTLHVDGQVIKADQVHLTSIWSAEKLRAVRLTINGMETQVTQFRIQPSIP